jgi:hypothetical protein
MCTIKILRIRPKEQLSLQYHSQRNQLYEILDNGFIISYSSKPVPIEIIENENEQERFFLLEEFLRENLITVNAKEGDQFGFHKLTVHRATYIGSKKYGRILDLAFGVNDEKDIFRIKDKYERENR